MKKKISLFMLCGIILLGVCGCGKDNNKTSTGNEYIDNISYKDIIDIYKGFWVLQDDVEGVKQNIKIDNIIVGCAGDATNCLHKNKQYMVWKNDIFDNYNGNESYVCLELKDKDTLIQTNCKDDGEFEYSSYNYIKEMGIIYKRK